MNRRILIADDDRMQLCILNQVLKLGIGRAGDFDIRMFNDGEPLVSFFRKEFERGKRIPLCILDMKMTDMDGIESAKALRGADPEVFILIVTSYDDVSHNDLLNVLEKDVYFLNKPIRSKEFLALVTSLLISWNHQQALRAAYQEINYANLRLRMIIENMPTAVAMLDNQLRYQAFSRRWAEELRLKDDNLIGKYHYDVLDIPEHWKEEHKRCLTGEIIRRGEDLFVRADGSTEYLRRELYPLKDSKGNICGILIFVEFKTEKYLAEQVRREAEEKIRENETYLKAVMSAIQTGVMIIDPEGFRIVDVNPYTLSMFQCGKEGIIGKDFYEFRADADAGGDPNARLVCNEYALRTLKNEIIHVRRSVQKTTVNKKEYLVQSLLDITDIMNLIKKQEISIELAKYLLYMVNGTPAPCTALSDRMNLFFDALYLPCFKEGGDHYFVRSVDLPEGRRKSLISLKDQSGHEVGCILRSIITDLTHCRILNRNPDFPLRKIITLLNRELHGSGIFESQDFFTSIDASIDHQTLEMEYVSAGHPRFFLIRGNEISGLPGHGCAGRNLPIPVIPDMQYSSATCRLNPGDRLIFYSDGLNELLTYQNLKSLLEDILRQNPASSVSELIRALFSNLSEKNSLSASPDAFPDDITVLGLEIESGADWNERRLRTQSLDDLNQFIFELHVEIFEELKQKGFAVSDLGIRSVLSESIMNAWIHGNRRNRAKTVTVGRRYRNGFHLAVHDEGQGFDYSRISDPRTEDNITRSSGRGIYIIRRFSDAVCWENGGRTTVISIKKTE